MLKTRYIKQDKGQFQKEGKTQRYHGANSHDTQAKEPHFIQMVLQTLLHFITNV